MLLPKNERGGLRTETMREGETTAEIKGKSGREWHWTTYHACRSVSLPAAVVLIVPAWDYYLVGFWLWGFNRARAPTRGSVGSSGVLKKGMISVHMQGSHFEAAEFRRSFRNRESNSEAEIQNRRRRIASPCGRICWHSDRRESIGPMSPNNLCPQQQLLEQQRSCYAERRWFRTME